MKRPALYISIPLVLLLVTPGFVETIKVSSIRVKGLRYLAKYEIIDSVSVKNNGESVMVQIDRLRLKLAAHPMVKDFSVERKEGHLTITVEENKPTLALAIRTGGKMRFFEMDNEWRILSRDSIHSSAIPVVIVSMDEIVKGAPGPRVVNIFNRLMIIREKAPRLFHEITIVNVKKNGIELFLRGRKTVFSLSSDEDLISDISIIAGYLDGRGSYPGIVTIKEDSITLN